MSQLDPAKTPLNPASSTIQINVADHLALTQRVRALTEAVNNLVWAALPFAVLVRDETIRTQNPLAHCMTGTGMYATYNDLYRLAGLLKSMGVDVDGTAAKEEPKEP